MTRRVEIRGEAVESVRDVQQQLHDQLDFAPFYGWNLNALWDRLYRDTARPVRVVWTHAHQSRRRLGDPDFLAVAKLLRKVADQDLGKPSRERFEFVLHEHEEVDAPET